MVPGVASDEGDNAAGSDISAGLLVHLLGAPRSEADSKKKNKTADKVVAVVAVVVGVGVAVGIASAVVVTGWAVIPVVAVTAGIAGGSVIAGVRLEKVLNELRHNHAHLGSEPSFWRDDAWANVDEALPALPSGLLKEVQDYYMQMRSARDAGSYSPPRTRYREGARTSLPALITQYTDFMASVKKTPAHNE